MKLWKKTLLMFFALLLLSAGTVFVYGATVWNSTTSTLKSTYTKAAGTATQNIVATQPLTVVLAGVDTGGIGRGTADDWDGNTDSQIVLTLNPKTQTATMISMERDTPTNVLDQNGVSTGSTQKMNAAFSLGYNNGGLSTAAGYLMQTISNQAGIPINNYMLMNFDGLINLVNDVGGVSVVNDTNGVDALQGTDSGNITLPVTYESVASGAIYISDTEPAYTAYVPYYSDNRLQTINGDQALVYARDRHTLINGDYGRAAHQRIVLQQLAKKILSMNNISQYQKFLNDIGKDFKTNIPVDISSIQTLLSYKDCFKKIVSIQYQGVGETYQGASYQFMPQDVDLAVQNAMRRSLGESSITSLDSKVITYESEYGDAPSSYYLPSATITENNKTTVMGVNPDGSFAKITNSNSNTYVSTNGAAVQAADGSTSSSTGSSSTSSSN